MSCNLRGLLSEVLSYVNFLEFQSWLFTLSKFEFENGFSCVWISEFENQIVTSLGNVKLNANDLMNTKMTYPWNHEYVSPRLGIFSTWSAGSNFFFSYFCILSNSTRITITNNETLSLKNIAIRYTLINGEGRRKSGILLYPHFFYQIWIFPQKIVVIWNGRYASC